jgi:hypothetical protein
MEGKNRWVIYQVFGNFPVDQYVDDLTSLCKLIGRASSALRFALVVHPMLGLPVHNALETRWKDGDRSLGTEVRAALRAGPMFSFSEPLVHFIPRADNVAHEAT